MADGFSPGFFKRLLLLVCVFCFPPLALWTLLRRESSTAARVGSLAWLGLFSLLVFGATEPGGVSTGTPSPPYQAPPAVGRPLAPDPPVAPDPDRGPVVQEDEATTKPDVEVLTDPPMEAPVEAVTLVPGGNPARVGRLEVTVLGSEYHGFLFGFAQRLELYRPTDREIRFVMVRVVNRSDDVVPLDPGAVRLRVVTGPDTYTSTPSTECRDHIARRWILVQQNARQFNDPNPTVIGDGFTPDQFMPLSVPPRGTADGVYCFESPLPGSRDPVLLVGDVEFDVPEY